MSKFDWQQETERQWDSQALDWNRRSRKMWEYGSRKKIIPFIQEHLPEDRTVLDIGCGDGYGSSKLDIEGYQVVGIDLSKEMITLAKNHFETETLSFIEGSVTDLPFDNKQFSGVMAINVLEWVETPLAGLKEVYRVLKRDGLFFAGILGPTAGPRINSYPRLYNKQAICNTMMPWEFQRMASENGFQYVDGFGVYKKGVKDDHYKELSLELKQALSFMWVFCLRKL